MTNTPSGDPQNKDDKKSFKDKLSDSIENFKKHEKVEEIYNYATNNVRDTIAYVLIVVGLLLLFLEPPWYGATLIGVIFGLYFAPEISNRLKNYPRYLEKYGIVKSLILGGTVLALFIATPFLFIGTAVAVGIREFFISQP